MHQLKVFAREHLEHALSSRVVSLSTGNRWLRFISVLTKNSTLCENKVSRVRLVLDFSWTSKSFSTSSRTNCTGWMCISVGRFAPFITLLLVSFSKETLDWSSVTSYSLLSFATAGYFSTPLECGRLYWRMADYFSTLHRAVRSGKTGRSILPIYFAQF